MSVIQPVLYYTLYKSSYIIEPTCCSA